MFSKSGLAPEARFALPWKNSIGFKYPDLTNNSDSSFAATILKPGATYEERSE
jgi:hypothetical protein